MALKMLLLKPATSARNRGFTLLEVMIALLILSVALLGIAALVTISLKADDSAYMRTQADNLAYQVLDFMRADRSDAVNSCFNGTFTAGGTVASTCGSASAATTELWQWQQALTALPAGASGTVTTSVVNGVTIASVSIQWNDSRAHDSLHGTTSTYTSSLGVESAI